MESSITPKTVVDMKQVPAEEIKNLSEQIMTAEKSMNASTDELQLLSDSLYSFSASKQKYDKIADQVPTQMRNLVTKI